MGRKEYICNRLKGSDRCLKMIGDGKCPSKLSSIEDEFNNCCGRKKSVATGVTQPDSTLARELRSGSPEENKVEILFV